MNLLNLIQKFYLSNDKKCIIIKDQSFFFIFINHYHKLQFIFLHNEINFMLDLYIHYKKILYNVF